MNLFLTKPLVASIAITAAVSGMASTASADNPSILLDPPQLDYKALCKPVSDQAARPTISRDWTKAPAAEIDLPAQEIVALSLEYFRGSDRLQKSPDVAEALLRAGLAKYPDRRGSFLVPLARVLMENGASNEKLREAESNLLEAYATGNTRAAYALGEFYGDGGPVGVRDLAKARQYVEKSALASDPEGIMEYARIVILDPQATAEQKKSAITNALLGLMGEIKDGDCSALKQIGFLYLRGNLIEQDVTVALRWMEAFAQTGDVRTAQNLSDLYRSDKVDQIDIQKSMSYLKQAADGGIVSAQFSLGRAYATGISMPQDLDLAERYLMAASEGGLRLGDEWLARLYAGDFGSAPDVAKAKIHFERAMLNTDPASQVPIQYGSFLAGRGSKEDVDKALLVLEAAARAGSVEASDELGKIYLELSQADSAYLPRAFEAFSTAAKSGNADGAAKLAGMFACGQGAPLSVELSNDWRHKAAIFGSVHSIYLAGLNMMMAQDPATQEKGRIYLQQAALKGNPDAIGYVVARWEAGADGFEANREAADRLLTFVSTSSDEALKHLAELAIISNRFDVAGKPEDKLAQIAAIDPFIAAGDQDALLLKSQLLQRSGRADGAELKAIYRQLAEAGDPRGMREYGKLLLSDLSQDASVGQEWLRKAAAAGDFKAKISLIDPADPQSMQALASITSAGEACTVDAMVYVARVYATIADPQAKTLARYWLSLAEKLSDRDADDVFTLGAAFRDGIGGIENRSKAESFFLRSYALGRSSVLRDLAEGHLQGMWAPSSMDAAKGYLLKLYGLGDKEAANKLIAAIADGRMPSTVAEVDQIHSFLGPDVAEAGKNFLKLARLNQTGRLGDRDDEAIARWLTVASEAGDGNAMYRLYQAYFFATGREKDVGKAIDWLTKSAEAGNPKATRELAMAYKIGVVGLPADAEKAAFWEGRSKELSEGQ